TSIPSRSTPPWSSWRAMAARGRRTPWKSAGSSPPTPVSTRAPAESSTAVVTTRSPSTHPTRDRSGATRSTTSTGTSRGRRRRASTGRPPRRAVRSIAVTAARVNCVHGCHCGGRTGASARQSTVSASTATIRRPPHQVSGVAELPEMTGHGAAIVTYPTRGAPDQGTPRSWKGTGAVPMKPTTRAQVDGHRFLARRARYAVVARDVRMLHDPLKRQSMGLTVGVVAAVLGCAGAAILALIDPSPEVDRTQVMVGGDSGQMYVRAGDAVHPVLNLASARLILGEPVEPATVNDVDVAVTSRGGLLGIPGAPSALPAHRDAEAVSSVSWTVCDEVADADRGRPRVVATSVVAREDGPRPGRETGPDEIALVSQEGTGWLIREGTRARIDLADGDLLAILGLGGVEPRPVTAALLDPLTEVAPVARPRIDMAGEPVDYGLPGLRIGQVFTVETATGTRTHVALSDGVREVGPVVADV